MRLASVLNSQDLPLSELRAMQIDGELVAVDEAFAPIDQPPSPTQRAASVAMYCQERLIAEQRTAAWIWGATLDAPRRHELCVSIGARARTTHPGRLHVREVVIAEREIATLGAVRVTTPMRTVMDLARFQNPFDQELVRALLRETGLSAEACIAELRGRLNLPQKKLALRRLAGIDSIHVVHRVDPTHGAQHPIEVGGVAHLEDVPAEGEPLARGGDAR
jgi:hypothetical protein